MLKGNTNPKNAEVTLLSGLIGEKLRMTWEGNLKALNWEQDFLLPFKQKDASSGYIGLGKTLSGLIHAARHIGGEADSLRRWTINELLGTQDADGYIGTYEIAARTYKVWDVHEQAYIMQALIENAARFGDNSSLQAAERLGRWLLPRLGEGRWREIGNYALWHPLTIIGLDRAMTALSQTTGDPSFVDFCQNELAILDWCDPIVEGRQSKICGHAYAYLARCLAQLEMNGSAAGDSLPEATRAVIGYLRAGGGLVISGTIGQSECWHSDQRIDGCLGETCATAYLVRWSDHLLRRTHDAWFGDLMERSIYNAFFAAGSSDGRRIRYYTPAEGERKWFGRDTYCCPGNYRRIIGELPDFIARPYNGGLEIDLYEACRITAIVDGSPVSLEIITNYPFDNEVTVNWLPGQPQTFPVCLRYPGWAEGVTIRCNGETLPIQPQKGWIVVKRRWQSGDKLNLIFAMPWKLIRGFRRQLNRVALMRGPLIWGADPTCNNVPGDQLAQVVPDLSSCHQTENGHRATIRENLCEKRVEMVLMPFAELNTAVTYFTGQPGGGDEPDHLLWLAADPIAYQTAPKA